MSRGPLAPHMRTLHIPLSRERTTRSRLYSISPFLFHALLINCLFWFLLTARSTPVEGTSLQGSADCGLADSRNTAAAAGQDPDSQSGLENLGNPNSHSNTDNSGTCAAGPAMSNPVAGTQNAGSTAIASALKDVPVERIVGPGNDEVVKIGSFWESQVRNVCPAAGGAPWRCRAPFPTCTMRACESSPSVGGMGGGCLGWVVSGWVGRWEGASSGEPWTCLAPSPTCTTQACESLPSVGAMDGWDGRVTCEFVDGGYWKGFSLTPSLPRCPAAHCPPCCSLLLTAAPCCSLPSLLLSAAPCCSLPSLLPTGLDHLGVDVFVNGGYWKGAAFLTHTSLPPHCCSLPRRTLISASMDHLGVDEFVGGGYWKGGLYIDDGKRTSLPPCTAAHRSPLPSLHRYPHTTGLDHLGLDEFVDGGYWKGELYIDDGKRAYSALQLKSISLWQRAYSALQLKSISLWQAPASLRLPVVRAAAGDAESSGAEKPRAGEPQGERAKGIFEFVTDNPSSRSAIQLKNAPAMDGNVGQMISAIEDKGKDMGSYLLSGEFQYFVRQIGNAKDPLVVYLHGAPAQSWGFREVMQQMAEKGYRGIAPDWLGFGFSEKPQPGYYFAYTEDVYHQELDRLLETLNVTQPFYLVVHGYLVGSYGLTWALKNASRLKGLAILNTPLSASSPLPQIFQQLRLPFVGEFQCQNAVLAERFIEKGSPYSLELDNADVYRLPYLDSGEPGFSLLETARKANPKQMGERIQNTLSASSWTVPTVIAWGKDDPYIPITEAQAIAKANSSSVTLRVLEGAGHTPQED
ncbi:unnamed protein product, partial [Closterium sp. NIES-53]